MATPLRRAYGEVRLRRGSILYHISDKAFRLDDHTPMLFLTLHPSDGSPGKYITRITLLRDVTLLFMVDSIRSLRIEPLLHILTETTEDDIHMLDTANQICYGQYLLRENFDGWLTKTMDGMTMEVGLLNLYNLYSYEPSRRFVQDWTEDATPLTTPVERWGTTYPLKVFAKFRINRRYKENIEEYLRITKSISPYAYTFQALLSQSVIDYHAHSHIKILWRCEMRGRLRGRFM
jgi:hypothetical protein